MDIASRVRADSSPVVGPNPAVGERQFLDVWRIHLAIVKLPHERRRLYRWALKTYTWDTMIRYAITSRALYTGGDEVQKAALLRQASRWAADSIDFIQLREKDLPAAEIAALARAILQSIDSRNSSTKLLINSRLDIAIAIGAVGVHLSAAPDRLTPAQVRNLFASARHPAPIITISCHTLDEVQRARENEVDAILFGPVFEKAVAGQVVSLGRGLDGLRAACIASGNIPVYALGGVTPDNAARCLEAGAAGIAGIRLFHDS